MYSRQASNSLRSKDDLELLNLLLLPSESWNYRHAPLYPVRVLLGVEPRAVCIPGKRSTD